MSLLFGVATADHQCEGYVPRWEDVRDRWERDMRLTQRGRATDFWTRYPEDVELARSMGCTAFRFSVAWARVEPEPGTFDTAVLDHYREMVDAIAAAGMEPVVTLVHNTWPIHIQDGCGGLIGDGFPQRFEAYAARVATALAPRVRWWVTFNEPNLLLYGYLKPWWQGEYRMPPGLPAGTSVDEQMRNVRLAMRNLFVANALGRQAIKAARDDAMVGTNPFLLGLPDWLQRFLNWRARRLRTETGWEATIGRRARRPLAPARVDMVAATLSATRQRGREIDFSRPYHVASLRLLVPAGSAIVGPTEARGATVAVVRGSTAAGAAATLLPSVKVLLAHDDDSALAAVASGRAAALLGDEPVLNALAERAPGRWKLVGAPLRPERYVVGVPTGDAELLRVVDDVISGDPPSDAPLDTRGNLDRIRRRGRLVAGVRDDVPGFGYRDPDTGRWSGREVELARSVAGHVLGDPDRVDFQPLPIRARIPALRSWQRLLDPLRRWFDMLLCALDSDWWFLGMRGELPDWLCPSGCEGQQDYVGLDYYWGVSNLAPRRLRQLSDATTGDYSDAPVWPAAMRRVLRRAARAFPGLPVLVVENGCVTVADGVKRADYLRRHVAEALRARAEGVPLIGYLCWTITSNREWGLPFGPSNDFGLYEVHLDTDPDLRRIPTSSVATYKELIDRAR